MITGTIYTDPYSGHEVLILNGLDVLTGAAYDPRRADLPTAWSASCTHCQNKRFRDVPLHVKNEIWMLMTSRSGGFVPSSRSKITELTVPTNLAPHVLRYWTDSSGQHAHIIDDDKDLLRASRAPGEKIIYESDVKMPDRNLVHRALKFIFSVRPATPAEIIAVSTPLFERQRAKATICGYRKVCDKISWNTVLQQAAVTK